MEELDIATKLPMWVNVFIGIAAALGGLEFIKWIVGLIANWSSRRKKESAEAKEADATAGQQDADWRQKELELMTAFVDTAKQQYEDLTRRYDELKAEKDEDRKIKGELRLTVAQHERKIEGLQRAFTESEARRKDAEYHYCADEKCGKRKPRLGTYTSQPVTPQPRAKNGQFIAKPVN